MDNDVYKAPESDLTQDITARPEFYVVSISKMLVLFFATLGAYAIFWFYQNWKNQKIKYQEKIWPVPRGIFGVFFAHTLFRRIDKFLTEGKNAYSWSPDIIATIFVVSSIFSNLASYFMSDKLAVTLSMIALLPVAFSLYSAQKAVNAACDDITAFQNNNYSIANIIWIILGILFWAVTLLGAFVIFFGNPEFLSP